MHGLHLCGRRSGLAVDGGDVSGVLRYLSSQSICRADRLPTVDPVSRVRRAVRAAGIRRDAHDGRPEVVADAHGVVAHVGVGRHIHQSVGDFADLGLELVKSLVD